jgi:hypothetical protein
MMDLPHIKLLIGIYSVAPAVIIGICRYAKVLKTFRPFILLMVISLITEIATHITVYHYYMGNAVIINIYNLIECLFWLWLFYNWNAFKKRSPVLPALATLLIGTWVIENIIFSKLSTFSSGFIIIYSFTLVFLSINQVNKQIVEERKNLFTDAKFLICAGILLFYTDRILIESFYLLDIAQANAKFLQKLFNILQYANLFVNLLFAFAAIWIPTRQRFSLPSS